MPAKGTLAVIFAVIVAVISIYYGFWGLEKPQMDNYYRLYTWYFIAFALLLFLQRLMSFVPSIEKIKSFLKLHWQAALIATIIIFLAFMASKPQFRILADESNLASMSQSLYEERLCQNVVQSLRYYHGFRRIIESVVDMRPAFYSFAVAGVHSLTGYRLENAFLVNGICGWLILFLVYILVQRWFGRFWGITSMLLIACYPLFVLYVTSGGFEVINLMMAMVTILISYVFLISPNAKIAELLLLTLPLLAQTRYESALAVFCVLPLIFIQLPKAEYLRFTWRLAVFPVLFLPIAWLRVITYTKQAFQVGSVEDAFSFRLFESNIRNAIPFFFGSDRAYGMVTCIAALAVIGMVWFLTDAILNRKIITKENKLFTLFCCAFFLFHAGARFAYYWGNMRLQYTSRMGLIFLPVLAFFAIYSLVGCTLKFELKRSWVLPFIFLLFIHGWPVAGQNLAVRDIHYYREYHTVTKYLEHFAPDKDNYLLVSDFSNLYISANYSAVNTNWLRYNQKEVMRDLERRTWQRIFIIQKLRLESNLPLPGSEIPTDLPLKTVYESQLDADRFIRISVCYQHYTNSNLE